MLQSILLTVANFGSKKGTGHIRCSVAVFVQEYFFYERISLFLDEQRICLRTVWDMVQDP